MVPIQRKFLKDETERGRTEGKFAPSFQNLPVTWVTQGEQNFPDASSAPRTHSETYQTVRINIVLSPDV